MPDKGLAYNLETTRRQPLTKQNLEELGITDSILNHPSLAYGEHKPIGVSINEAVFGTCPGKAAAERGWITYMNIGEPMIEERSNITQPAPDTLSSRAYVNLSFILIHGSYTALVKHRLLACCDMINSINQRASYSPV